MIFQIIPQSILLMVLFADIFYYGKIKNFIEILIIGLSFLLFRYYKYSLYDVAEEYTKDLENKYYTIDVSYDEDEDDWDDDKETHDEYIAQRKKRNMIWDGKSMNVREYLKIKYENYVLWLTTDIEYQYEGTPYINSNAEKIYKRNKYNDENATLTYADKKELEKDFFVMMPQILCIKYYLELFPRIENRFLIKSSKIFIFSFYFIAWFLVLTISYYHFPIELKIFKYFLEDVITNLIEENNPFSGISEKVRYFKK